jgi:glycosyltransferase involved in cell wall biosynthesis
MAEGATAHNVGFLSRKFAKALQTTRNQFRLAWEVFKHRPTIVLTASMINTQAPLWIWPHILLVLLRKTVYATNLHFSAREHTFGPKWWHRLGASLAYRPFRIGIAHKRFPPPNLLPDYVRNVEVPLGPEVISPIRLNPKTIRAKWKVPRGKKVFLAFGSIRNHKNIDLAIRALIDNPQAHLVVLGSVSSHKDRPLKYYQMLAADLGLSSRVYLSDDFIPDENRLSYFQAADFVLLTYSSGYHSQSATLTTAVNARRCVLAASGSSPMRDLVEHFGLGVFVEPDSSDAVADGMATLLNTELPEPVWEGYEAHATWENNVIRLLEATADYVNGRRTPVRQFEARQDEAMPVPRLLNARALQAAAHPTHKPRTPAKSKPRAKKVLPPPVEELQPEFPIFQESPRPARAARPTKSFEPDPISPVAADSYPVNGSNGSAPQSKKVNGHAKGEAPAPEAKKSPRRKRAVVANPVKPTPARRRKPSVSDLREISAAA